jgi:hypothetical protein
LRTHEKPPEELKAQKLFRKARLVPPNKKGASLRKTPFEI